MMRKFGAIQVLAVLLQACSLAAFVYLIIVRPMGGMRSGGNVFDANAERVSRIAFEGVDGANLEIYAMNPDGTNIVRLTNNPGMDGFPIWSPDGTRIAFSSERFLQLDL